MDYMTAIDALYEYVNAYADHETIMVFNDAYDKFISWQLARSKAIKGAELIGEKLISEYLLNETVSSKLLTKGVEL